MKALLIGLVLIVLIMSQVWYVDHQRLMHKLQEATQAVKTADQAITEDTVHLESYRQSLLNAQVQLDKGNKMMAEASEMITKMQARCGAK